MAYEFKLPDIGEGVAEGEITKWLVKEGDAVREDQPMVEVMTDKATVEITSPVAGRIQKIMYQEGAVAPVHQVIVIIEQGAAGTAPAAAAPAAPPKPAAAPAPKPVAAPAPAPRPAPAPAPAPAPVAAAPAAAAAPVAVMNRDKVLATPATRHLARELGVEIAQIPGSGPRGRVLKDDVRAKAASATAPAVPPPVSAEAPVARAVEHYAPAPATGGEERVPYRGLRKAIGDQMVRSLYTAPHFTLVDEIDFTGIDAIRQDAKDDAAAAGTKLTYLPFVMKALCQTIRKFPTINATLDEERGEVVIKRDVHVGFALDTERGLMVPVVKNVGARGVLSIAREIGRLSELGRTSKASREDLTGSTITITSAGSIGGLFATPIINFPEVSIIGLYQIADRPVVRDGQIVIRKMGYVSITLDHRVVDGGMAARVLNEMKRLLGNPGLLLLGD